MTNILKLTNFVEQGFELIHAAKELKGVEFHLLTENDIADLSWSIMNNLDRDVKFDIKDCRNVLRIAVNFAQIIHRHK